MISGAPDTRRFVSDFFALLPTELAVAHEQVRRALESYYRPAGLLTHWRKPYFRYHYIGPISRAMSFLIYEKAGPAAPVILDLGCGTGTQSLMFAACGARVIALDCDQESLDVSAARQRFYEGHFGRPFDISWIQGDALNFDWATLEPLDGIYSLFAFNMMQPSSAILTAICRRLKTGGRISIQDGNKDSLKSILSFKRRDTLRPHELRVELRLNGLEVVEHRPTGCIPPVACALMPEDFIPTVDRLLRSWRLGVSHTILAERVSGA